MFKSSFRVGTRSRLASVVMGLAVTGTWLLSFPGVSLAQFCANQTDPSIVYCEDFSGTDPLSAYTVDNGVAGNEPYNISITNEELVLASTQRRFSVTDIMYNTAFDFRNSSFESNLRFDTPNALLRSASEIFWTSDPTGSLDSHGQYFIALTLQLDERRVYLSWGLGAGNPRGNRWVPWVPSGPNEDYRVELEIEEVPGTSRPTILALKGYVDGTEVIGFNEEELGIDMSGFPPILYPSFRGATHASSPISHVYDDAVIREKLLLHCEGYEPPLAGGAVKVNKNRALPFKAQLYDELNIPVLPVHLGSAPPVIRVIYHSGIGPAEDVTDEAIPAGKGTPGNQFVFEDDKWQFNLLTKNYTAPGTYTVTMVPGNGYFIEPTCAGSFVIQ